MKKAQRKYLQQSVGLSLIAVTLLLGMASVHPGLHQALHQDASCSNHCHEHSDSDQDNHEHSCGVTLLQTGAILCVDQPTLEVCGQALAALICFSEKRNTFLKIGLPKGRAPPIAEIV